VLFKAVDTKTYAKTDRQAYIQMYSDTTGLQAIVANAMLLLPRSIVKGLRGSLLGKLVLLFKKTYVLVVHECLV